eukprot:gene9336-biopygen15244
MGESGTGGSVTPDPLHLSHPPHHTEPPDRSDRSDGAQGTKMLLGVGCTGRAAQGVGSPAPAGPAGRSGRSAPAGRGGSSKGTGPRNTRPGARLRRRRAPAFLDRPTPDRCKGVTQPATNSAGETRSRGSCGGCFGGGCGQAGARKGSPAPQQAPQRGHVDVVRRRARGGGEGRRGAVSG